MERKREKKEGKEREREKESLGTYSFKKKFFAFLTPSPSARMSTSSKFLSRKGVAHQQFLTITL